VLLWFVGGSALIVWLVFHDPRFDYRLVAAGALLPDVIDGLWGGSRAMHSVTAAVAVLVIVMLATIGRRAARRRWLALPIGLLLHLLLDGVFTDTEVFWWPFTGLGFGDASVPSADRGWLNVLLEAVGAVILVWFWRRFDLSDPAKRRRLVRTGQLTLM